MGVIESYPSAEVFSIRSRVTDRVTDQFSPVRDRNLLLLSEEKETTSAPCYLLQGQRFIE